MSIIALNYKKKIQNLRLVTSTSWTVISDYLGLLNPSRLIRMLKLVGRNKPQSHIVSVCDLASITTDKPPLA